MHMPPIHPISCPYCGSQNIGIKEKVIPTPWRTTAKKVWAYCRDCSQHGKTILCTGDMTEAEEIVEAFTVWNKTAEGKQHRDDVRAAHPNHRKH